MRRGPHRVPQARLHAPDPDLEALVTRSTSLSTSPAPRATGARRVWFTRGPLARAASMTLAGALVLSACSAAADDPDDAPAAVDGAGTDDASTDDASTDDAATDDAATDDAATDDGAAPPADGPLSFTAATVSGGELDVATLAGEPVVLWFWAPWCTICRAEAPDVTEVAAELEGQVTFLGVAGLGPVEDMQGFVEDTSTGAFEHLADTDGSLWGRFSVSSQPTFAFVSSDGSVDVVSGALGSDALRERATALLDG